MMSTAGSMDGHRTVRFMKNGNVQSVPAIQNPRLENGFVYLWALFTVVLAGIAIAGAGQMWQVKSQRDKEAELMFIGEEFRKAIMSYHNTTKQYPSSLEELLKDSRSPNIKRHIRKIYVDPMTNTTEWGLVDEPPPNTTPATSNASSAQNKGSTTGSSATSSGSSGSSAGSGTAGTNQSTTNPNQASALNQTGSTGQATTTGQSATNPGSNVGTTPESKPPTTSSSGMSSSIGTKITGVYSLSERKPIKKDRFPEQYAKFKEALTYRDWQFVYKPDSKTAGTGGAAGKSGAAATKPGGAAAGAANSPFSPSSSSSSRGGAPTSPGAATGASPFGSPSQPAAPRGGGASSPFGPAGADDD